MIDPDDIRRAALAAAKLGGCTCDVTIDTPAAPIRPGAVVHVELRHDDTCPLIRARARHTN